MAGGSASALSLSRPALALLALRPTGSLSRPKATFVTRLQPIRLPARAARQLPDQSTTLWVDSSSTSDSRLRGARHLRTWWTTKIGGFPRRHRSSLAAESIGLLSLFTIQEVSGVVHRLRPRKIVETARSSVRLKTKPKFIKICIVKNLPFDANSSIGRFRDHPPHQIVASEGYNCMRQNKMLVG